MLTRGDAGRDILAGLEGDDADLAVGIREIDADRFRTGLGQLDHLCFEDDAVERDVDHCDHRLHSSDAVGRAAEPDGIQAAVDCHRRVDRLAERLVAASRRLAFGARRRVIASPGEAVGSEARLARDKHVVRLDRDAIG